MEEKLSATDLKEAEAHEEQVVPPAHDPHGGEKGALMGGIGGALTGMAAGALAGPVGAVVGGTMGAIAGSLVAAAAVTVATDYEEDPTQGIAFGAEETPAHVSDKS